VANNLKVEGAGFGVDTNIVTFISQQETEQLPILTKEEVAHRILDNLLKQRKGL
jgi:phosphopantothenoylcysteine decarboxylase/phosphopantothenate--cysteine ligase